MSTSGGGNEPLVVTKRVNAAALSTLFSAPTTILAAPGAGKMLNVSSFAYQAKAGVVSYAFQGNVGIVYGAAYVGSLRCGTDINSLDMLASSAPIDQMVMCENPTSVRAAAANITNQPLTIACDTANPDVVGSIVTSVLNGGGTGYAANDTGTIDGNSYGTSATYKVLTVAAVTGAVLTYQVTSAGNGYSVLSNPFSTTAAGAQPGVGVNFTVNVTATPPPDGDVYVTVDYDILTVH